MPKYIRRTPAPIDAMQWGGQMDDDFAVWIGKTIFIGYQIEDDGTLTILTLAGATLTAAPLDYVIRIGSVKLDIVKPDTFEATYVYDAP